jgi:hypothetical protein
VGRRLVADFHRLERRPECENVAVEPTVYEAALDAGERRIAELRAILAPLLEDPFEYEGQAGPARRAYMCRFCLRTSYVGEHDVRAGMLGEHAPDCRVLRRDALLGRTS